MKMRFSEGEDLTAREPNRGSTPLRRWAASRSGRELAVELRYMYCGASSGEQKSTRPSGHLPGILISAAAASTRADVSRG